MRSFSITATMVAAAVLASSAGSAQELSIPASKWGPDDEIGAANLLSPELTLQAAKLIKTGKVYPLGIETNSSTPAYPPRSFKNYVVQPGQQAGVVPFPNGGTYNDDIVEGWLGIGSQIDGLGHVGVNNVYYNQNKAGDFAKLTGLTKLGIENVPPIVTRGVLLDMAAYMGVDVIKEGTAFNRAEIEGAAQKQGVEIREGDVVLFHTGWLSLLGKDDKRYAAAEPGLGEEGGKFLASKNVIAVGADTWGLDALPPENPKSVFINHITLLAQNGIYILENMNTAQLAADRAYEFMFVLGPAKVTGAVQMIINPVAIR